jgi:D-arabinose 1-dehydrogenase-like Zn-dependent alcohol dehydrogenase
MVDIPKTCKSAVLEEYGHLLQIRDVVNPSLEPKAILVKVEMAGICGNDIHQHHGTLTINPPLPDIQGHETIGRIVALGEGRTMDVAEEPLQVGDRIM